MENEKYTQMPEEIKFGEFAPFIFIGVPTDDHEKMMFCAKGDTRTFIAMFQDLLSKEPKFVQIMLTALFSHPVINIEATPLNQNQVEELKKMKDNFKNNFGSPMGEA